jgi:flagellar motor component MotA
LPGVVLVRGYLMLGFRLLHLMQSDLFMIAVGGSIAALDANTCSIPSQHNQEKA